MIKIDLFVLEKDPRGSKVLERCDIVSTSEIKAGKEQLDHEEEITRISVCSLWYTHHRSVDVEVE